MDTKLFVRRQPGGLFSVIDKSVVTGSIFWVNSDTGTDGEGFGQNPNAPIATIDYAIGLCTADAGDVIYVMPGHAEDVLSATGLLCDVAGVAIIGLGRGTKQPKVSLTTAAGATISITAANVTVENIWLHSNFTNGVTAGVTVAATGDGFTLEGMKFTEETNAKEFLIGVSVATTVSDGVIRNCRYHGTAGGDTSSIIDSAGAASGLIIEDNYLHGDCSAAAVKLDTAAITDLQVINNRVINIDAAAGLGIDTHAGSTGMMADNHVANLRDTVVGLSGAGMAYSQNYASNALNASGIILPAVDS
jgi:hypothetical protein